MVKVLGLGLPAHPACNQKGVGAIEETEISLPNRDNNAVPVGNGAENPLHHGQVFPVVVRLKECHAQVKFKEDASNRPHVTRLRPAQLFSGEEKQS